MQQNQQQQNSEFQIRPKLREKFKPSNGKEIIKTVLISKLKDSTFNQAQGEVQEIAEMIKIRLKDLGFPRYKYIVHVTMGSQNGQGLKNCTKCHWDYDTDNNASDFYINESLFCFVQIYAIYLY